MILLGKSCFFIGHANTPNAVLPILENTIEQYITERGCMVFYVGHYGAFDRYVAYSLRSAKEKHPEITTMLVTPYHPATRSIEKPDGFDGILFPLEEKVPQRYAIAKSNEAMIDSCDFLIAYVKHLGKSRDFLEYAQRRQKKGLIQIMNLADLA